MHDNNKLNYKVNSSTVIDMYPVERSEVRIPTLKYCQNNNNNKLTKLKLNFKIDYFSIKKKMIISKKKSQN